MESETIAVEHVGGDHAASDGENPVQETPTPRVWLLCSAVVIAIAVVAQRFGEIVFMTRVDRVLDPLTTATRNVDLWNPYWDLGLVHFQSIGYWIPFDAFFITGSAMSIPPWVLERMYVTILIATAMWGFVRLVDALRVGTPLARLIAGIAYATSPIMLARIGWQTPFAMGVVFLPWALVWLVRGAQGGSERRSAARSGVAIALIGGANAVVTLAVLPIPMLYLLTRQRGPRRTRLILWWLVSVVGATLWWVVGMYYFARFGPDVLEYTEQVDDIVQFTSPIEVLRGTADWVMRLGTATPAAAIASGRSFAIVGTSVVAGLGLAGLCRPRLPERSFLVLTLMMGVVVLGGAAGGWFGNPFADEYRAALDGPLQAFRNIYKFQPMLLLPLSVGLAHLLDPTHDADEGSMWRRRRPTVAMIAVGLVVLVGALPLWTNRILRGPGVDEIPAAWNEARDYLAASATGRVLVLPGIPEGDYEWGFTSQHPLEWGADIAWATRSQAPLGGLETIDYLDAIERAIERGGEVGLQAYLRRGGFSNVLVAADARAAAYGAPTAERVSEVMNENGMSVEAAFGPDGYGDGDLPQISVFAVDEPSRIDTAPLSTLTSLSGEIGSTLAIPESVFGDRPYLLSEDADISPSRWVITDDDRATVTNFGFTRNNRSYVHGANEIPFGSTLDASALTTLEYEGIHSVSASSVGPGIFAGNRPSLQPANAIDRDGATHWQPFRFRLEGDELWGSEDPWIEIDFGEPVDVENVRLRLFLGPFADEDAHVDVTATVDGGSTTSRLEANDDHQGIGVVEGLSRTLRLSIARSSYSAVGDVIGIAEILVPGVVAGPRLNVPSVLGDRPPSSGDPDPSWVLTRRRPAGSPLVDLDQEDEIGRTIHVPRSFDAQVVADGVTESSTDLLTFLGESESMSIRSSSTWFDAAGVGPHLMIDGDPGGSWRSGEVTGPDDESVSIDLDWSEPRLIDEIRLDAGDEYAPPDFVTVRAAGVTQRSRPVDDGGVVQIRPVLTSEVGLRIEYDARPGDSPIDIGFHTLEIGGIEDLMPPPFDAGRPYREDCRTGPQIRVGDATLRFRLSTTIGALVDGHSVSLIPCSAEDVELPAGPVVVESQRGSSLVPVAQVVIGDDEALSEPSPPDRRATILEWDEVRREVDVAPGPPSLLIVNEVYNAGWVAELGSVSLKAIRIDGWRQGFIVPAGEGGTVILRFAPDRGFKIGTVAGLVALVALMLAAVLPDRRRSTRPSVGAAAVSRWAAVGLTLAVVAWFVGVAVAIVPAAIWLGLRCSRSMSWIAFAGVTGAATLVVLASAFDQPADRWGASSVPVSALASLSFVAVAASWVVHRVRQSGNREPESESAASPEGEEPTASVPGLGSGSPLS